MAANSTGLGGGVVRATGLAAVKDAAATPQTVKGFIDGLKTTLDSLVFVGAQVNATSVPCESQQSSLSQGSSMEEEVAVKGTRKALIRGRVGTGTDSCCKMDTATISTYGDRHGKVSFFVVVPAGSIKATGSIDITTHKDQSTFTYRKRCNPPSTCENDELKVDIHYEVKVELSFEAMGGAGGALGQILSFFGAGWKIEAGFTDVAQADLHC